MKSHTQYLTFHVPARVGFINITGDCEQAVAKSGIREGLLLCNAMHITASVFINDNESGTSAWGKHCKDNGSGTPRPASTRSPARYAHNRSNGKVALNRRHGRGLCYKKILLPG